MPDNQIMSNTSLIEAAAGSEKRNQTRPAVGVLYHATVVDNVDPKKQGRVRIQVQGISSSTVEDGEGKWAWTINLFGGGHTDGIPYGAVFPYPIGSKVIVAFLQADVTYGHPVVLGGWYQEKRIPDGFEKGAFDRFKTDKPYPATWGYVTPKGHAIMCREEDDNEQIELISQGGRKFVISDKKDQERMVLSSKNGGVIELLDTKDGAEINMSTRGGSSINLNDKTGDITMVAVNNLNISCRSFSVLAAEDADIKCGKDMGLHATNVSMSGSSNTLIGQLVPTGLPPAVPPNPQVQIEGLTVSVTAAQLYRTMVLAGAMTTHVNGLNNLTVLGASTIKLAAVDLTTAATKVTAGAITATTGTITATTGAVTLTAPTVGITGTVNITGYLNVV